MTLRSYPSRPSQGLAVYRFAMVLGALAVLCNFAAQPTLALELADAVVANQRCVNCHGQDHIAVAGPTERSRMVARGTGPDREPRPSARPNLLVTAEHFQNSPHEAVACVSCHVDAEALPHAAALGRVNCDDSCHVGQSVSYRRSVHAELLAAGNPDAPDCSDCHGGHDIRRVGDPEARTHPLKVVEICAGCHEQFDDPEHGPDQVSHYMGSVHGQAIMEGGLVVAATCANCHGSHEVLPADREESTIHHDNIPATCGQCHAGVSRTFLKSVHGQGMTHGNGDTPVCIDCHTAHAISASETPQFMQDIVGECGDCHNEVPGNGTKTLYQTYRESYHGQVTSLGSMRGARCSDCHGAHDILPASAVESRIHPDNLVSTCRPCHENANAGFVQYRAHADWTDRENYPVLYYVMLYFIIVISSTFTFFGLHSIAWGARSLIHFFQHGRHQIPAGARGIKRFNRVDRINHAFIIISFFGLTLTGLPLFFSDQPWASTLAGLFGGVHAAGIWHRVFAIMLMGNFAVHFAGVINRIRKHSFRQVILGPNSMLPRWRDLTDLLGMIRWFFGGPKPTFDRWTYWEKFDYWAEIFGTTVIGVTGLMLWFPEFTAQYLPGYAFNIATVVHGYEAMLAIGFIFTVHFFNAHLRAEKFPVDDVMFTGQLPEPEFMEERGAEYDRMKESGELESLYVPPPPWWYRPVAVTVGLLAMAIGLTMVTLMVLAGLGIL